MKIRWLQVARAYLVAILFWSALAFLMGVNYLIFDRSINVHSTLSQMLLLSESQGLAYAVLTPPVFYLVGRAVEKGLARTQQILLYIAGVVPFALSVATVRWILLPGWDPATQKFLSHAHSSPLDFIYESFADLLTMYIATLLAAHAYAYVKRVQRQDLERANYQQALASSQLQVLRMQLHPHFLFNTLHGIASLVDSDREKAKLTIVRLSNLLRTALKRGETDLVSLQEELHFVDGYLDIERMRFSDRLRVTRRIEKDTLKILVPQFVVQLLVENSIRHGAATSVEGSWVELSARVRGHRLEIEVSNSVGAPGRQDGGGLGLQNTRERLRHLYGEDAALEFVIDPSNTAIARLTVPALTAESVPEANANEVQACAS